jgi:alpha-galactosidase
MGPVAVDLYRQFGVFPIGDTCTPGGGSWPYWYHENAAVEQVWREDPAGWWDWYFQHMTDHFQELERISIDSECQVSAQFAPQKSGEVMIPLIESLACDIPRILIGNIPNAAGFVPGVPTDIAVEIPLFCGAHGIQGVQTGGLPQAILAWMLRDRVAPVNLELEAYSAQDRDTLIALALTDPFTRTLAQAQSLVEEIMNLDFHAEMRAHYR